MLRVFHQLHLSHSLLFQALDRSLRKVEGIATAHQVILFTLSSEDGLTSSEVARRTGHSKSRLTGLVNTLEELGMVRRGSRAGDGRVSTLSLTDLGRGVVSRTMNGAGKLNEEILAPFSREERDTIARFLSRIQSIAPQFDSTNHQS